MKIKTLSITICLFGLICFFCCSQSKKDAISRDYSSLTSALQTYLKQQETKGFKGTVLVAKGNEIIINKAFGDKSLTANSAFYIASLTKQFTAAAILKLQESGKLSVNDPLTKFINEVPLDKKEITIHHLLTHSSGLADNYPADGIINRTEAIDVILSSPLAYKIGEKYSYSGEGYNLLAIIIELVSGETYEDYISKKLLAPTNLNHTGFWGFESDKIASIASFSNPDIVDSLSSKVRNKEVNIANYGYKGGTGLFSTSHDLYKWINTVKHNGFINQESKRQLFNPYINLKGNYTDGIFYAYGWRIEYKDGKVSQMRHGGLEDGQHDVYIRNYTNGDIIIVFSNSGIYKEEGRFKGKECWSFVLSTGIHDILDNHAVDSINEK